MHHFGDFTCRGGTLKAGTYRSLRVTGVCTLTSKGTVTVRRDVVVGSRGMLNTLTPGTFNVRGSVLVREHGVAGWAATTRSAAQSSRTITSAAT